MIPPILNFEFQINLIALPIFSLLPDYGASRTLDFTFDAAFLEKYICKYLLLACFYQSEKFGIREFKIG